MRFFLGLLLSLSLCFSTLAYTVNAHSENNIFMNTTSDADAETASDITTEHTAAPVLTLTASSALLMDAATGTVLFEQNAAKERPIASVTKIMTLLLIFQALHNQTIQLEDLIPVSAHAASMGGSQVYLEEGETQTVETLIKCIVVASANDACDAGRVTVNGKVAKAGTEVKIGDVIEIKFGNNTTKVEVLAISETQKKEEAASMYKSVQ